MPSKNAGREFRLSQLEFLLKSLEMATARSLRISTMLIYGNAGAIATCALVLKDLPARFNEWLVIWSIVPFVVGLLCSGLATIEGLHFARSARRSISTLVINTKSIATDEYVKLLCNSEDSRGSVPMLGGVTGFSLGVLMLLAALWR